MITALLLYWNKSLTQKIGIIWVGQPNDTL